MNKFSEELERAVQSNVLRIRKPTEASGDLDADSPTPHLSKPYLKIRREESSQERRKDVSSVPTLKSRGVENHLISLLAGHSFEAEQYRKLCHLIEGFHDKVGLSVIAVSSAAAGDGKSTTSINLAGALTQTSGARVLLMDFDLRRPSISDYLGVEEGDHPGVLDLVHDSNLTLDDVAVNLKPLNLGILLAGGAVDTPYELPGSLQLERLFSQARRQYDYVILDTPPIFPFLDCRLLEQFVDGFLLVVAKHKTPRKLVEEAVGILDPNKVVGMILNNSEKERVSGYYGYAAYYQYGSRRIRKKRGNIMGSFMQKWRALLRSES